HGDILPGSRRTRAGKGGGRRADRPPQGGSPVRAVLPAEGEQPREGLLPQDVGEQPAARGQDLVLDLGCAALDAVGPVAPARGTCLRHAGQPDGGCNGGRRGDGNRGGGRVVVAVQLTRRRGDDGPVGQDRAGSRGGGDVHDDDERGRGAAGERGDR